MAVQQLFDAYESTLSAPYTSGGSSLSIASTALPEGGNLPTSGNYTVTVRDSATNAIKAIFTVTSRSGSTLTTVAQLDANCASGDIISGYTLSKSSLSGLLTDYNGIGSFSAAPSLASNQIGARYTATDANQDEFRWNGTSWDAISAGLICSAPVIADFPTAVISTNGTELQWANVPGGGIIARYTGGIASNEAQQRVRTIPTAPYLRRMRFYLNSQVAASGNAHERAGMTLRNSGSGKFILFTFTIESGVMATSIQQWDDPVTPQTTVSSRTLVRSPRNGLVDIAIEDDNAGNRNYYLYADSQYPILTFTEGSTTFITPDQIGFGTLCYGAPGVQFSVVDWRST